MIYFGKETKDRARWKTKDGMIKPGLSVAVTDDVIATGGSTTAAISVIR